MRDSKMVILFESMAKILENQREIMRHLGITKHDSEWGWDDCSTEDCINNCYGATADYRHDKY